MPGVLDAQLHVGRETTYGTPVATSRSYEALADGHKRPPMHLVSEGMRIGAQATESDRSRIVNMGAEGPIEVDVHNKGLGLLLQVLMGPPVITTPGGGVNSRLHTYASTSDAPNESLTVKLGRPPVSPAAVQPFTYHGGVPTKWSLSQEVGDGASGLLKLKLEMDYEDEDTTTALDAPAYPTTTTPYGWPDLALTVAGAPVDIMKFGFEADANVRTDRRFCRGSSLKKMPKRQGRPTYTGQLDAEFEDLVQYDRFRSGAVVPIVASWTGAIIEGAIPFLLRVTLQACQYTGETPQVSLDDMPQQPLPFKVLWDRTNPAVKVEYQTTDLAA